MPMIPPTNASPYGESAVPYGHGIAGGGLGYDYGAGAGLHAYAQDHSNDGSEYGEPHGHRRDFGSEHSGGSQGSGHSSGSARRGRGDSEERQEEEQPRRPCCSCSSCGQRAVLASVEDIERVLESMKRLSLQEPVVVGGELVGARSHLLRIGNKWWRNRARNFNAEIERDAKDVMKALIAEEQGARLVFSAPRQPFPWCITLKCPCLVFFCTIALVGLLCVAGISGSVSIDTNFDSFMDSDSQSSLYYNAFLAAIKDRKPKSRRLQPDGSTSTWPFADYVKQRGLRAFQDLARAPALDDSGRWYPLRSLARMAFSDDSKDVGTWIRDNSTRRLQGTALYKLFAIQFTYVVNTESDGGETADKNVLQNAILTDIQRFEQTLKRMPQWRALCEKAEWSMKRFCDPGVSFVNIAFASRVPRPPPASGTTLKFNGSGEEMVPMEVSVEWAKNMGILELMFPTAQAKKSNFKVEGLPCKDMTPHCAHFKEKGQCKPFAEHETYMQDFCPATCGFCGPSDVYNGTQSLQSGQGEVITAIRSNFVFQAFCCFSAQAGIKAATSKLSATWDEFIENVVKLVAEEKGRNKRLRILYTGDGIEGYEAMAAVMNDLLWAAASYGFVLLYATLHTRSIFLASNGLFLVMLSIPSALSIFSMASGMESVSLMSCLSIFIVIGLGSDMLFVYTDFWKQSIQHSRDPVKRLKFTYTQAASSTAATTFTTAMSFLANLASVLRPLREFGFFMGACVVMAWLIIFIGYPPILVMGERCHRRLRHGLGRYSVVEPPPARRPSLGRQSVQAIGRRSSRVMSEILDPEKKGVGEMHQSLLGSRFADFLRDWKCCLLILFLILTTGSLGLAVKNLEQAGGVPQIFPPEHNQVQGKKYNAKFLAFDKNIGSRLGESIDECTDFFGQCTQFKCDTIGRASGSPTNCACAPYGERSGACTRPHTMRTNFRVLGRQGLSTSLVASGNYTATLMTQFPHAKKIIEGSSNVASFSYLADNWENGRKMMATMVRPAFYDVLLRDLDPGEKPSICEERQICYCGIERCEGSGSGLGYGNLRLGQATRRLDSPLYNHPMADPLSGRQLAEIRPEDMVDVNVIFGMKIVGKSPLLGVSAEKAYQFDSNFNLQDPWAQRRFEGVCKDMQDEEELHILRVRCWFLGFRDYWLAKNLDWPVRPTYDMDAEVINYARSIMTENFQTTTFMWIDGSRVRATYVVFFLRVSKQIGSAKALEIMGAWDTYVQKFNAGAESAIKGMWHASKLWVRAEAEKVILDSTLVTLGISLGCVFLGVVLFTRSVHLAFLVMIIVMSIIISLLFFMTVMMSWPVGAIEVLSLIVFVGFAVDYCLHVAHKYHSCHINSVVDVPEEDDEHMQYSTESPTGARKSSRKSSIKVEIDDKADRKAPSVRATTELLAQNRPEERFSRTRYALERMGGAVVGSSMTTVGCAAFLLPCQLAIFTKIGSVVMAVTVFAILYTLLPLPALLMACGPCGNDFKAFVHLITSNLDNVMKHGMDRRPVSVPAEDDHMPRRYVLHMPNRSMGVVGPGIPATRTRVTATG